MTTSISTVTSSEPDFEYMRFIRGSLRSLESTSENFCPSRESKETFGFTLKFDCIGKASFVNKDEIITNDYNYKTYRVTPSKMSCTDSTILTRDKEIRIVILTVELILKECLTFKNLPKKDSPVEYPQRSIKISGQIKKKTNRRITNLEVSIDGFYRTINIIKQSKRGLVDFQTQKYTALVKKSPVGMHVLTESQKRCSRIKDKKDDVQLQFILDEEGLHTELGSEMSDAAPPKIELETEVEFDKGKLMELWNSSAIISQKPLSNEEWKEIMKGGFYKYLNLAIPKINTGKFPAETVK